MAENRVIIDFSVTGDGQVKISGVSKAIDDLAKNGEKNLGRLSRIFDVFAGTTLSDVAQGAFRLVTQAAGALFDTFQQGIKAAQEQEDAINELNRALAASGQLTPKASADLQEFAGRLQAASKFGDEAVLSTAALIQSLGGLKADALIPATQAAADLAAALGIDLRAAALLVGKAAAGEVSSFSRYGLIIQQGASRAETFAKALDAINSKFGGAAAAQVNTYSGAVTQLNNQWGDLLEVVGDIVIKNTAFVAVLKEAGKAVVDATQWLSDNRVAISGLVTDGILIAIDALKVMTNLFAAAAFAANEFIKVVAPLASVFLPNAAKSFVALSEGAKEITSRLDAVRDRVEQAGRSLNSRTSDLEAFRQSTLGAAGATTELTKEQQKLIDQGVQLAEQGANKDPAQEFQARSEALAAAREADKITEQEYQLALEQFQIEANEKLVQHKVELADRLIQENDRLIQEGTISARLQVVENEKTLQQILKQEGLSAKQREKVSRGLADNQRRIEEERFKAAESTLGNLAILQHSKNKDIAKVGQLAAIAQATIDTYRGATAAAAALAGIPIVGPALAAAAAASFIVAGLARVSQIKGVSIGLEKGMTEVPPGFPNDGFPARLTSGERVVDAGTNQDLKAFLASSQGMAAILAMILQRLMEMEMMVVVNIGQRTIAEELRDAVRSGRVINV